MGRFINADGYASTGQGVLGNNMFAYCNNGAVVFCDPCGTIAVAFSLNYDLTFFFVGTSGSIAVVVDDDWNVAVQSSYSAPSYLDPNTNHIGLADAGAALAFQITDDDTVFNLEGPACYGGFSAGAGPYYGVDMVYSGAKMMDPNCADQLPNGIAVSVGYGYGIDAHFKQTQTQTLWDINIKELLN